jgi:serine/threonine protein kinase
MIKVRRIYDEGFHVCLEIILKTKEILSIHKSRYEARSKFTPDTVVCVEYNYQQIKKYINLKIKYLQDIGSHPNLCVPLDIMKAQEHAFLIYERAKYDIESYCNYYHQGKAIPASFIKPLISSVLKGLQYLHSKNKPHGNVSPSSIIIFEKEGELPTAKLCRIKPLLNSDNTVNIGKTIGDDIRDLGITIYNMYHPDKPLKYQNVEELTFYQSDCISLEIIKLIARCVSNKNRISASDALGLGLFTLADIDAKYGITVDITLNASKEMPQIYFS